MLPGQNYTNNASNPVSTCGLSPLHGIFRSFSPEEATNLLNLPRSNHQIVASDNGWPSKRLAVDSTVIPSETGPTVRTSSISQIPVSLPQSFMTRDGALDQEQQTHLFGVSIDSSSLLMQNGIQNGMQSDSVAIRFLDSVRDADLPLHQAMSGSNNCLEDSGFANSAEDIGNVNSSQSGTFVKVSIALFLRYQACILSASLYYLPNIHVWASYHAFVVLATYTYIFLTWT